MDMRRDVQVNLSWRLESNLKTQFKRKVLFGRHPDLSCSRKCTGCGARMLNKLQESIPNWSSRMLYRMLKLPVMVDVAQGSRLGAWLRAWTLYKPSEEMGVELSLD
nr:hypothetical protein [Tanacetum cinerariifolium]